MKEIADQVRRDIDHVVENYSPFAYTDREVEYYLRGLVNGAWFYAKYLWTEERNDIVEDYLPMALEWYAMRIEAKGRR